jgi:hypothetical protein
MKGARVGDLYEKGTAACLARDAAEATAVVMDLIDALDFRYRVAAQGLFGLYERCLGHLNADRFEIPLEILRQLHAEAVGEPPGRSD